MAPLHGFAHPRQLTPRRPGRIGPLLIVMPLALAVCPLGCSRLDEHPLVVIAVEEVATNDRAAEALGENIKRTSAVTGSSSETDGRAALRFDATGSKAGGLVVVEGRKFENEWGVTSLEIRLPEGGERIGLTADLEERTGVDTPQFDPSKATQPESTAPPPGDVEIALPPGVPGGPPSPAAPAGD